MNTRIHAGRRISEMADTLKQLFGLFADRLIANLG